MSGSSQATVAVATPAFAKRKARAIIGWLTPEEGALWLAGRNQQGAADAALLTRCRDARAVAAARPLGVDQQGVVQALPPAANAHVSALAAHPWGARVLAEGGQPALVDLTRIRAIQPVVHAEDARNRVAGINQGDIAAIAAITIPIPPATWPDLQPIYDHVKQAHILASPSPNLKVMGYFAGIQIQIAPGVQIPGFGFAVALLPSFLSVVGIAGRYILTDGYHRAYGLLESGITRVPALVRECNTVQEAGIPAGMLSPDVFLGDRPALLPDYLDPAVSADTLSPITTKMVVVQALEVTPLG